MLRQVEDFSALLGEHAAARILIHGLFQHSIEPIGANGE